MSPVLSPVAGEVLRVPYLAIPIPEMRRAKATAGGQTTPGAELLPARSSPVDSFPFPNKIAPRLIYLSFSHHLAGHHASSARRRSTYCHLVQVWQL